MVIPIIQEDHGAQDQVERGKKIFFSRLVWQFLWKQKLGYSPSNFAVNWFHEKKLVTLYTGK